MNVKSWEASLDCGDSYQPNAPHPHPTRMNNAVKLDFWGSHTQTQISSAWGGGGIEFWTWNQWEHQVIGWKDSSGPQILQDSKLEWGVGGFYTPLHPSYCEVCSKSCFHWSFISVLARHFVQDTYSFINISANPSVKRKNNRERGKRGR